MDPIASSEAARSRRRGALLLATLLVAGAAQVVADPAGAANFTVTTTADGGAGSLRAAVDAAAGNGQDDVITLAAGADYAVCSPLVHDDAGRSLRITAPAGARPVIRSSCGNQIFTNAGARLELVGLELRDGVGANGGAVGSTGTGNSVLVEDSEVHDNEATARGGAVYSTASIEVVDSTIRANHADTGGGGVSLFGSGAVVLRRSVVRDNTTDGSGAGVDVDGTGAAADDLTVIGSAVFANHATGSGGGLRAMDADMTVDDSEVAENSAGNLGGGISFNGGNPAVRNSTVSANTAVGGAGGVFSNSDSLGVFGWSTFVDNSAPVGENLYMLGSGALFLGNAVGASSGATSINSCTGGGFTTFGHNVSGAGLCGFTHATDESAAGDLRLRPLEFNGPLTRSHHPTTVDSPVYAVGAGSFCGSGAFTADQREVPRPQQGSCEAGAVEADPLAPPPHVFSDVPAWIEDAVRWVWFHQYSVGFPDGTYRPDDPITRAQVVRQLHRVAGSPGGYPDHGLSDVPAWVDAAVRWGVGEGVIEGFPDGTFRPDDLITRAQNVRMLHRANGSPAGPPHSLTDVPAWIESAVRWAANDPDGGGPQLAVMTGFADDTFRPDLDITRAQSTRATHRAATNPLR